MLMGILSSVAFIMTIEFASRLNLFEDFTVAKAATASVEIEKRKLKKKKKAMQNVQKHKKKKK